MIRVEVTVLPSSVWNRSAGGVGLDSILTRASLPRLSLIQIQRDIFRYHMLKSIFSNGSSPISGRDKSVSDSPIKSKQVSSPDKTK